MATDGDIQLADMLESYPSHMTPGFQAIVTSKREFAEMASEPKERLAPGRGRYFKHQKFIHRFLRAYDDLLLIDETGTGKSCTVDGFIEYTLKEIYKARNTGEKSDEKVNHFKRVIILVKGKSQMNEIEHQIVCKCSDGHYETDLVKKSPSESAQKANIRRELKNVGYKVTTAKRLAHKIQKEYLILPEEEANQKIIDDYSDTIFWVDEAHNLIIESEVIKKKGKAAGEKVEVYKVLWHIFHLIRRSKRILSTATPMINSANDIGSVLNLILPIDGELPQGYDYRNAPPRDIKAFFPNLPTGFNLRTATPQEVAPYFRGQVPGKFNYEGSSLEDIEPYLRGRVGFVRAADTGIIVEQMSRPFRGIPHNEVYNIGDREYVSQLRTWDSEMFEWQNQAYQESISGYELKPNERQASNFVFPDGHWGKGRNEKDNKELHGFPAFIKYEGGVYRATDELTPYLNDVRNIEQLGTKFAEICRLVESAHGNCFAYGEFVDGSGAIALSLCLEGLGYERYNERESMFIGTGVNAVRAVCSGGGANNTYRKIRPDVPPKKRYALLISDISDANFRSMMEAMNSPENMHGDYIKVLISSRVGRDGINVNNVTQIHIIGAEWNPSALYQAESRGIRATSHEDLLAEEQQRLISLGEDPALARIKVEVYKHAAIDPNNINQSVDLILYRTSELKDRIIRRFMRMMKQCAIGCQINYNRNVIEPPIAPGSNATELDGTAKCDYMECRYVCYDEDTKIPTDYSTYDVLYADEIIMEVTDSIIEYCRQENSMTLEELALHMPYRKKYIIMALEMLITNKTPIVDRFGYNTYLVEDNGTFYLDRTYPLGITPSYPMAYYTKGIIAVEQNTLARIVSRLETGANKEGIQGILHTDPNDPSFMDDINAMSIDGRVLVLEQAVLETVRGNGTPGTNAIMELNETFLFKIHEPIRELERSYKDANIALPKRGRKLNPEKKHRTKKLNAGKLEKIRAAYEEDDDAEEVYVHILFTQQAGNYAKKSRIKKAEGRVRIFKPDEVTDGWRDLSEIEYKVYNPILQLKIADYEAEFHQLGYYGWMEPPFESEKSFHIVDKINEADTVDNNARGVRPGRSCSTWTPVTALINVMYHIGVPEPGGIWSNYTDAHRLALIGQIIQIGKMPELTQEINDWSLARIVYYYKWVTGLKGGKGGGVRITRKVICEIIRNHMVATNRMI